VKILDLGLARLQQRGGELATTITGSNTTMMGTVDYMAPEQALDSHAVDIRADIYSLGCTLFYLLTGHPPFPGGTEAERLVKHQLKPPPNIREMRPEVPEELVGILGKMLAKESAQRFDTPRDMAQALRGEVPSTMIAPPGNQDWASLERAKNEPSVPPPTGERPARRLVLAAAGASLAIVLGALVFWATRSLPTGQTANPSRLKVSAVAQPMRNTQLRDLGDNAWVKLGSLPKDQSVFAARWCYDLDQRRFVRIGGYGSAADKGQGSNEVMTFDLGAMSWTKNLPFDWNSLGRPGSGEQRDICYDREHHCFWDYCRTSRLWKGTGELALNKWTPVEAYLGLFHPPFRLAYDEHARRLVCLGLDMGVALGCQTFDPVTGQVEFGPRKDAIGGSPGFLFVPQLKGCLLIRSGPDKLVMSKFDARERAWSDLAPKGSPSSRDAMGVSYDRKNRIVVFFGGLRGPKIDPQVLNDLWTYDPARNSWNEAMPTGVPSHSGTSNPKAPAECQMLGYDEEHNAHIMILQEWGKDSGIWAYRYKR
jgi:hypothetical protein